MIIRNQDKLEALSTKYHADANGIIPSFDSGTSSKLWVDRAVNAIGNSGYSFAHKKKDGFKATMTTTVPLVKQVRLAYGWGRFSDQHKAVVLWHEHVHVRQQREMKALPFIGAYATPRGRWVLEMQAYRMSLRMRLILGMGVQGEPERIAGSMIDNYGPWMGLERSSILSSTIDVLSQEMN